jgi:GTP pyrophosphokinase
VRQWFKQQDHDRHAAEGRAALDKELSRLGIEEKPQLESLAKRYNFQRGDDLYAAIGRGELPVGQVARQVGEPKAEKRAEEALAARPRTRAAAEARHKATARAEVIIEGVEDLMSHMAQCCKPVPHDPIVGYVTRGRGVTVHRQDCTNLRKMPAEEQARLIDVRWAEGLGASAYPVDVLVVAGDRKGLLRDVSSVFSDEDIDVVGVHTVSDRTSDRATMRFTVEVRSMEQLSGVLLKLAQVPDVINVRRPH